MGGLLLPKHASSQRPQFISPIRVDEHSFVSMHVTNSLLWCSYAPLLRIPSAEGSSRSLAKPVKATALESMARAKASYVAGGWKMTRWLHENVTLPLAREEVTLEQAIQQATHWLRSYVNQ